MSQTTQLTEGKVKDIIASRIDYDASGIKRSDSFDDLGIDSLERMEIVWACEKQCNITIPNEETEKITTVEQLITFLEAQ
jgi:acyl carrier protein